MKIVQSDKADHHWSDKVVVHHHQPKRLMADGTAEMIFEWYKANFNKRGPAMSSLTYYINRAGANLPEERHGTLNAVKKMIHDHQWPGDNK